MKAANNIAIFADVQNIYYTTRQVFGRQFNYRKLWEHISERGHIDLALAYAIRRGDEKLLNFQNALRHIGFEVKLKPYIQRADGSSKGDWDVGITLDIIDAAKTADTIVLLSGDGDFDRVIEKIKIDFALRAEVYGVPELTAKSLIDAATTFYPIDATLLL